MKLDMTVKEYRDLLDLLSIARWVLAAQEGGENDERLAAYEQVVQKFYALAGEMESGNLIAFDEEASRYLPTAEYEDAGAGWQFIGDFEENSFWEELVERLTERDAIRAAGGLEAFDALDEDARHALLEPIEERYLQEFQKNGIENLTLKPAGAPGGRARG